jgi:hypothetical protein
MARMRQNTFNYKVIEAILYTPFILLGGTKRTRRSAARKWLNLFRYACK